MFKKIINLVGFLAIALPAIGFAQSASTAEWVVEIYPYPTAANMDLRDYNGLAQTCSNNHVAIYSQSIAAQKPEIEPAGASVPTWSYDLVWDLQPGLYQTCINATSAQVTAAQIIPSNTDGTAIKYLMTTGQIFSYSTQSTANWVGASFFYDGRKFYFNGTHSTYADDGLIICFSTIKGDTSRCWSSD